MFLNVLLTMRVVGIVQKNYLHNDSASYKQKATTNRCGIWRLEIRVISHLIRIAKQSHTYDPQTR